MRFRIGFLGLINFALIFSSLTPESAQAKGLLKKFVETFSPAKPVFPEDWIIHSLWVEDTRYPEGSHKRKACPRELIEIPYRSTQPRRGTALLIPGIMQNARIFDLVPEHGISYARYLMNEKGLKVYMLNVRGVGHSCYPRLSNLDDIAIDDIPAAVNDIAQREGGDHFIAIGHSMGGLALQASLAGLDRCGKGGHHNCFLNQTALERQKLLGGFAALGANVEMRFPRADLGLLALAQFRRLLFLIPPLFFDQVSVDDLFPPLPEAMHLLSAATNLVGVLKDPLMRFILWRYFYNFSDVPHEARVALRERALDSTNRGTLEQYGRALTQGLRATGGEKYADALGNIRIPAALGTFSRDQFADPAITEADDFDRLGSAQKRFFAFPEEGHQDFMMNAACHPHQSDLVEWLISAARN